MRHTSISETIFRGLYSDDEESFTCEVVTVRWFQSQPPATAKSFAVSVNRPSPKFSVDID